MVGLDNCHLSSDTRQMGLDQELVREAERTKEQLAVAQHAADRAKVDYHQAIRRLHAAGGSLREIAEAFRMSHQRVHQIINEAAEATRRMGAGPLQHAVAAAISRDRLAAPGTAADSVLTDRERQVPVPVPAGPTNRALGPPHRVHHLAAHRVAERVALLRSVHGDVRDPVLDPVDDLLVVRHACASAKGVRARPVLPARDCTAVRSGRARRQRGCTR